MSQFSFFHFVHVSGLRFAYSSLSICMIKTSYLYTDIPFKYLRGNIKDYPLDSEKRHDLLEYFKDLKTRIIKCLLKSLQSAPGIKFSLLVQVDLEKAIPYRFEEGNEKTPWFKTKAEILLQDDDIDRLVEEHFEKLNKKFEEFISEGSGWKLEKCLQLCVHTTKSVSYTHLTLPTKA